MSESYAQSPELLAAAVRRGERAALALALNVLDDQRPSARAVAAQLLSQLQPPNTEESAEHGGAGNSDTRGHLIGITGPPGAGKSSLTGELIKVWRARDLRVGVLAVDPSSPISGGALLGDRLRMKTSDEDDGVFVRSLSSRGEFGGLSPQVWPMSQVMMACFDLVLIETVGVGQREVDVASLCDTTCYVAQPGSGDSIQFLKAGILEVPHILVVNKQDMGALATRTQAELEATLQREHPDGGWQVPVLATSVPQVVGIEALTDMLEQHRAHMESSNTLHRRRRGYRAHWILKRLEEEFGAFGITQLGGPNALLKQLQQADVNGLQQYDTLRRALYNARTDT